jgi:nickel/cobalt transporter (NicO) family protein
MSAAIAPLLAAAGVALGHAVLPDHWVPLAVIGRTRRYPLVRIARLSGVAGIAHVLVSLTLGAVIIAIGLQFRAQIEHAQDTIVGLLLIGTGVAFTVLELSGHGHHHPHDHDHGDGHTRAPAQPPGHARPEPRSRLHGFAAIAVPFGAAASPDLTILPVFLAATAVGTGAAIGSLMVFALVTVATIVGLTVAAAAGGYQLRAPWLERWGNAFTAAVLIVIGALVLAGVL